MSPTEAYKEQSWKEIGSRQSKWKITPNYKVFLSNPSIKQGFPGSSDGEESACKAGDLGFFKLDI